MTHAVIRRVLRGICWAALLGVLAGTVWAQTDYRGNTLYRAKNTMSGNLVRTVFYNYGLVGNIAEISGEWPIGTGNEYVGDVSPMVGIQFVHPSGDTLRSVITSDGPRGNPDGPPGGGEFWGFEPLPGFNAAPAVGQNPQVAMSQQPQTWPVFWPDKEINDPHDRLWRRDDFDPGWRGSWNGYFGKDVLSADQESYFQMDDNADKEWFERVLRNNPDTVATWTPNTPLPAGPITVTYDAVKGVLTDNAAAVWMRWGINEHVHNRWTVPPQSQWPAGSTAIDSMVESPMTPLGDGKFQLTLSTGTDWTSLHMKFSAGADVDSNRNRNWNVYLNSEAEQSYYFYPSTDDSSRRGVGIRVAVRGLQWSHFLAQDCIFWLYEITNISSYTYDKATFGMVVGTLSGGRQDSRDDLARFDLENDITYSYDSDDIGSPGWVPVRPGERNVGYVGYAFLESPGNPVDGIDNDGDHADAGSPVFTPEILESMTAPRSFHAGDPLVLIDYDTYQRTLVTFPSEGPLTWDFRGETRRLLPGAMVTENGTNGLDDNFNGLIDERNDTTLIGLCFKDYLTGLGTTDLMIDEARDDGIDNDHDWNPLTDDVGFDGTAGTGDVGEADGFPTDGEPNFDKTDVNESDQIGLTAFEYFSPPGAVRMRDDEGLWVRMEPGRVDTVNPVPEDGDFIYGSGYFPLRPGQTERFSMALLYGEDLADITDNKITVQQIYDENYNFARPPDKPTVWAVPGDGKVTIYWDDKSERSFDRVCNCNDFEGYKIYRSTDPAFNEVFTVTDGLGRRVFHRPITQYDLDNDQSGFFPLIRNSVIFYLGNNSGIEHSFVDETVENGQTYYYAVCAYDRGDLEKEILPSENSKTIVVDEGGNVTLDVNTVVVTPRAPAAGYHGPEFSPLAHTAGHGTGSVAIEMVDPSLIDSTQTYEFAFANRIDTVHHTSISYSVIRRGPTSSDTLIQWTPLIVQDNLLSQASRFGWYYDSLFNLPPGTYHPERFFEVAGTPFFDGQRAYILTPRQEAIIEQFSGWEDTTKGLLAWNFGITNLPANDGSFYLNGVFNSADYQIEFYPDVVDTSVGLDYYGYIVLPATPVKYRVKNLNTGEYIPTTISEKDTSRNGQIDNAEIIVFREHVPQFPQDSLALTWAVEFTRSLSRGDTVAPGAGDQLNLAVYQNYGSSDRFTYSVKPAGINASAVNLDAIRVYPNPYVAASNQEPRNVFAEGRGERRVTFTHLPNTCTIRIYTVRGELVQTLEHRTSIDDGIENWDLRSKDGLNIAYGIYLYHIDTPYGEKVGRFAVIK